MYTFNSAAAEISTVTANAGGLLSRAGNHNYSSIFLTSRTTYPMRAIFSACGVFAIIIITLNFEGQNLCLAAIKLKKS